MTTQTAFVTGISTGIGLGLTEELLSRGWRVIGLSRREPTLTESTEQFSFASIDVGESATLVELSLIHI